MISIPIAVNTISLRRKSMSYHKYKKQTEKNSNNEDDNVVNWIVIRRYYDCNDDKTKFLRRQ